MNQQKQGSKNINFGLKKVETVVAIILATMIFFCCENDIEKINALTTQLNLPNKSGYDIEMLYTDSGILRVKLFTPEFYEYSSKDEPYMEFPKGIKVQFFDKDEILESHIRSNYAKYYEEKELWDLRNNVVAINEKEGKELYTEQLFWDRKTKKVYSNTYSKVVTKTGTFYGEKLEADQDMSNWKLKGSKGHVYVKNESEN